MDQNTVGQFISVVIPYFNCEHYIGECIQSIIDQNYAQLEIIIVNDASTMKSREFLSKFIHLVKIIDLPVNLGSGNARNIGVEHAQGDWIAFIDADDIWVKNKLKKQIEFLNQSPEFCGCHTGVERFNKETNIDKFIDKPSSVSLKQLLAHNVVITSSLVLKKQVFTRISFDPKQITSQDHDLCLLAIENNYKFGFIPQALTRLRREKHGNISSKFAKIARYHIRLIFKHKKYFLQEFPGLPFRIHLARYVYRDSNKAPKMIRLLTKIICHLVAAGYSLNYE